MCSRRLCDLIPAWRRGYGGSPARRSPMLLKQAYVGHAKLQLGRCLGTQGRIQDGLDERLEGGARGLGRQGESGGFGEAGDGLYVENPEDTFREDGIHPGVAGAAEDLVDPKRRLLDESGGLGWYLGGDGEVRGAGSVLSLEVIGPFAGTDLHEPERPRSFARRLYKGDGDLRPFHPAFEQDLGVVTQRLIDGVEEPVGFLDPREPEA